MPKLTPWKRKRLQEAKTWVLGHPTASIAETMRACEVTQGAIRQIRKELMQAGLIHKFPHTKLPTTGAGTRSADFDGLTTEQVMLVAQGGDPSIDLKKVDDEIERILAGTANLSRETRRKKLEALVLHGAPDHVIRANESLERMDKQDTLGQDEVGIPPPQTLEEAESCCSDVVEALMAWGGEESVKRAVTKGMTRCMEAEKMLAATTVVQPDLLKEKETKDA